MRFWALFVLACCISATVVSDGVPVIWTPDGANCALKGDARTEGELLVCPKGGGIEFADTGNCVIGDEGLTMTATVRIRRPLDRDATQGVMLFAKGNSGASGKEDEWLFGRDSHGELCFLFRDDTRKFQRLKGGRSAPDGQWAHYAARVARISRPEKGEMGYAVAIYVNGELVAAKEFPHVTSLATPVNVRFGIGPNHAKWYFCGDVADVRLYRRPLSDDEIEKDAISTGRIKIAGGVKCTLTPVFVSALEKLSGEDAPWLRNALKRAAEGGADQEILAAGVASGGVGVWKVFEFPRSKALVLLKGAGRSFPLAGFLDRRTGREVFARRTFAWRIETGSLAESDVMFDTDAGWLREVHCANDGFSAVWSRDGLKVDIRIALSDGRIESRLRVDNSNGNLRLRNVAWPMASLARLPGSDRLLLPYMNGIEHFNPVETKSEIANQDGVYPSSSMGLQMGAYYNDDGGIYYAMEDPTASAKRIAAAGRRGGIDVSFSQEVAIAAGAKGGNSYEQPGTGAIELFAGDWFDAGQIYKRFLAAKAPWWVADLPRTETPEWFRNNCLCAHLGIYLPTGRTEGRRRNELARLQEMFEMPVMVSTRYYVDHDKTGFWPHYTPDPDRVAYLDGLRGSGIRISGYIDDRLWCTTDGPGRKSDWMYSTVGSKLKVVKEDGSEPQEVYGGTKGGVYGDRFVCKVMCPSASGWRDWLTGQCETIARDAHLDAIYHDQIMACAPIPCFDPSHGHALNDPQAWVLGGYTPYLKEMRCRVAAINPSIVHSSEDGVEVYCKGQLDGCVNWRWCYEMVPLFTSLYAGRFQFYGRVQGDGRVRKDTDHGAFFAKMAEELVWGEQIGAFLRTGQEEDFGESDKMLFAKKMAHLRRALLPYLNESEFMRPPKFRSPMPRVGYVWYRAYGIGKVVKNQVRSTAWQRQRDGARMAVFVNSEDSPIEVEPVLPGFGNALAFVDGAAPVAVKDGAFRLNIGRRGFAVVVSGDAEMLAAEGTRLGAELKRIASFEPPTAATISKKKTASRK